MSTTRTSSWTRKTGATGRSGPTRARWTPACGNILAFPRPPHPPLLPRTPRCGTEGAGPPGGDGAELPRRLAAGTCIWGPRPAGAGPPETPGASPRTPASPRTLRAPIPQVAPGSCLPDAGCAGRALAALGRHRGWSGLTGATFSSGNAVSWGHISSRNF